MAGKASKMNERLNFKSVEELLGVVNEESAMDIEICKISSFKGHPFKVVDDEKMQELVESIKANGVLSSVLIRPTGMDTYEMISGHRRLHAAQLAGLTAILSIIREMTDDESVIAMVDANIQREELLPSEKAWAYKMKMDAVKHQGIKDEIWRTGDSVFYRKGKTDPDYCVLKFTAQKCRVYKDLKTSWIDIS